jgi:hypothetical protein
MLLIHNSTIKSYKTLKAAERAGIKIIKNNPIKGKCSYIACMNDALNKNNFYVAADWYNYISNNNLYIEYD